MIVPKLSDAIALGYAEIRHNPCIWLAQLPDGTCSGCAIGAALYAMGERSVRPDYLESTGVTLSTILKKYWPWTLADEDFLSHISVRFGDVAHGKSTIEDLIAWVRSVEPADDPAALVPTTEPVPTKENHEESITVSSSITGR